MRAKPLQIELAGTGLQNSVVLRAKTRKELHSGWGAVVTSPGKQLRAWADAVITGKPPAIRDTWGWELRTDEAQGLVRVDAASAEALLRASGVAHKDCRWFLEPLRWEAPLPANMRAAPATSWVAEPSLVKAAAKAEQEAKAHGLGVRLGSFQVGYRWTPARGQMAPLHAGAYGSCSGWTRISVKRMSVSWPSRLALLRLRFQNASASEASLAGLSRARARMILIIWTFRSTTALFWPPAPWGAAIAEELSPCRQSKQCASQLGRRPRAQPLRPPRETACFGTRRDSRPRLRMLMLANSRTARPWTHRSHQLTRPRLRTRLRLDRSEATLRRSKGSRRRDVASFLRD